MRLKLLIAILGMVFLSGYVYAEDSLALKSQKEKMSYIIGVDFGRNLKGQPVEVDPEIVARGMRDAFSGGKLLLTEQEIRETMTNFQKEMIAKQQALAQKNKKEGEAFLSEDKKKNGIVALPSGLQYKVIKAGTGRKPKPADSVTVHYRGALIDGREFFNSYLMGQPETLNLKEAIPGLAEALGLMQEGAKWLVFVPPNLAYGDRGAGSQIGPNAALIFEVELISVQEKK